MLRASFSWIGLLAPEFVHYLYEKTKKADQRCTVLFVVTLLLFVTLPSVVFSPAEEPIAWNMVQKRLQIASLVLRGITALSLALLLLEHVVLAASQ